jgi:hypothetical protein
VKPDWTGRTAVVICSGPSLTAADCGKVKVHKTIVTNTSYRLAPWADVLFGHDAAWWRVHHQDVDASGFIGRRYCMQRQAPTATCISGLGWIPKAGNSGACALALAVRFGAAKVILIGADCKTGEKTHWHGDHPEGLGNAGKVADWPAQFKMAADFAQANGVEVVNCTRDTALECIRRGVLEDELWTPAYSATE